MSVMVGFTILLMLTFLGYMGYRLFLRRKLIMLISVCLQIFSLSIAIVSFITNVQTTEIVQTCYIVFGVVIPSSFFVRDYIKMIKKFREHGVYEGFIEAVPRERVEESDIDLSKKYINPIIKERQVPELIKDLNLNKEDIIINIKKSLSQAQAFLNNNDYENSYEIYNTLLKLIRNCPGLFYNFGNTCYQKGSYSEAIQSYKKVLEVNQEIINQLNSPDEVFAVVKSKKDSTRDMYDHPKTEADIRHEEYIVYYNLGNAEFKLNKFEQAIESYKNALHINPSMEEANENIARALIALERKDEAIEYYLKVVNGDKNNYRVHYIIGKLYYEIKRYNESIVALNECLKLNSKFIEVYEALAEVLARTGKHSEASEVLKKLAKLNSQDHKVFYNLGTSYYHMGLKEDAIEYFKKVIELKPDSYKSYFNMAVALDEMGQQEEAIKAFKKVIELRPDFIDAYNNLGIILSTQGRRLEALDVYTKGLKKNPEEYSLYYNMGITLSEMERYYEAVDAYKNALEIKPDEYEINYHMGAALTQLKRYSEAIESYKKALKVKPMDSELYYNISVVYSLLRKHDIAIDNLKKAIDLNSGIREEAKYNKAFDYIRTRAEFRELVS